MSSIPSTSRPDGNGGEYHFGAGNFDYQFRVLYQLGILNCDSKKQLKYKGLLPMGVADAMKLPTKHQKSTGILRTQRQDAYVLIPVRSSTC